MIRARSATLAAFLLLALVPVVLAAGSPTLQRWSFADGAERPSGSFRLFLVFDAAVGAADARPFIKVTSGGTRVGVEVDEAGAVEAREAEGQPGRVLVVRPTEDVGDGRDCVVTVAAGLPAAAGGTLSGTRTVRFTTASALRLLDAKPETTGVGSARVHLSFSEPVSRDAVRKAITITPYTYCWPYQEGGSEGGSAKIRLDGGFQPGTEYRIVLDGKLAGVSGSSMGASRTLRVVMPPVSPAVSFVEENRVIERKSRQLAHVAVVNVDEVVAEVVRIPPRLVRQAFKAKIEVKGQPHALRLEQVPAATPTSVVLEYLRLFAKNAATLDGGAAPTGDRVEVEAERFFCSLDPTASKAFSIPLSYREEPSKGGTVLVRVSGGGKAAGAATPFRLFQITDLGLTVKKSEGQLLVWVTSLETGKPVGGARVWFEGPMYRYDVGTTGPDGVVLVDLRKPRKGLDVGGVGMVQSSSLLDVADPIILAATDDDCAWADLGEGVLATPSGIQDQESSSSDLRGYAFTDRGIYRPGDEAHYKAVFRTFEEGSPRVPADRAMTLVVTGPRGDVVLEESLNASDFGSVHGTLPFKKFHPLGTYTFTFHKGAKTGPEVARTAVEVQEFRPPRHKVRVDFRRGEATDERFVDAAVRYDFVTAAIRGLYYAGGPVRHGKVTWVVRYVGTSFDVPGEGDFEFRNHLLSKAPVLETGESMLDDAGGVDVRIPIAPEVLSGGMGLEVEATVLDFDGRPATTTERFTVRPSVLVGTSRHPETMDMGASTTLKAIVLGRDGTRIPSGTLDVEVMRESWMSVRKRDATGELRWESEEVFTRHFSAPLDIVDGVASFEFDFRQGGAYLIRFHYKDADGTTVTAASRYDVQGYWYDNDELERAERTLTLAPDKLTYAAGETATLAVRGMRRASSYLFTLERDGVLEYRLVDLPEGKGTLQVPLTAAHAPTLYASLVAPCARVRFPIYATDADAFRPVSLFGVTRLSIRPVSTALAVDVTASPGDRDPRPGDRMEVTVQVRDGAGVGVESEVALCVVDEGILALTGFKTPDLAALFAETVLPLGVVTSDLRALLLAQTPFRELATKPFTGGDGGGESGGRIRERADFDPLAFWAPALTTDSKGLVTVAFTLPDTVTAYRVFAVVVDRGERYGAGQIERKVVKPFYLEPGLPRFLVRGDVLTVPVQLFNKTDRAGTATLDVMTPELVVAEWDHAPVAVGPYASAIVPVKLQVRGVGDARLSFEGRMGTEGDRVTQTIPVRSRLTLLDRVEVVRVDGRAVLKAQLPQDMDDVPADERSGMAAVLTLTDNPLTRLTPGLRYLLAYPYGCVEQTSSGVMSLAGLRAVVASGKVPGITVEETDKFLGNGVERILSMQLEDGSFSYWPGTRDTHSWGTAIAVQALTAARDAGFEVPAGRFDAALGALAKWADGYLKLEKPGTTEALAILALVRGGKADGKLLTSLAARQARFGREARTLLQLALLQAGTLKRSEADVTFQELLGDEASAPSDLDFEPGDFGSASRELAFLLLLACEVGQGEVAGASLAERLLARTGSTGRWSSTHDTGWCLLALARYFGSAGSLRDTVDVTVRRGGAASTLTMAPGVPATLEIAGADLVTAPETVVEAPAGTPLYARLEYRVPVTEALRRTLEQGWAVTRSYHLAGDAKRPVRVGDVVEVRLDVDLGRRGEYLVLEDPLPAGFVAVNSKLKTEPAVGSRQDEESCCGWWDGWWAYVPQHVEMRDDRVVAFRDRSWGDHYRYVYYVRAVAPGTFTAPSAKIQEMYRPGRVGFAPAVTVTVEPQKP